VSLRDWRDEGCGGGFDHQHIVPLGSGRHPRRCGVRLEAAIRNHSKTVALYCAQQGWKIRCNSIHPAAILTPIWEPMLGTGPDRDARMQALVADTPLKRFGMPDEVAAVAVMLASDEATYITGTEVSIDGGLLAGSAASPG
jgi:3(or 17)beta-hydroxysteroid dehydrogenase